MFDGFENQGVRRRDLLQSVGAVTIGATVGQGLLGSQAVGAASDGAAFPQPYHGPQNTGYNPNTSPPVKGLTQVWEQSDFGNRFGGGPPLVTDGYVCINQDPEAIGPVRVYDAETGTEQWNTRTGSSAITAGDGSVYVFETGASVQAYALSDGTQEWTASVQGWTDTAPTYHDGTVYTFTDDALYAHDADSGDELWSTSLNGGSSSYDTSKPAVYNGEVIVCDAGTLAAFDAADGSVVGGVTPTNDADLYETAAVADGLAYTITDNNELLAIDWENVRYAWRKASTDISFVGTPAVADGTVFAPFENHPDVGNGIFAFDATDGTLLWGKSMDDVPTDPVVAGGYIFLTGSTGLHALDAETGTVRWTAGDVSSKPAVVDGRVYAYQPNTLRAFEEISGRTVTGSTISNPLADLFDGRRTATTTAQPPTGSVTERWSESLGANISHTVLTAGDGKLFVEGEDDAIHALDPASGDKVWTSQFSDWEKIDATPTAGDTVGIETEATVGERALYVGDLAGGVHAIDPEDGSHVWVTGIAGTDEGGGLVTRPVTADGAVFAANTRGELYRLDPTTGESVWRWASTDGGGGFAVENGTIVYRGSTTVFGIDAASGDQRWSQDVGKVTWPSFHVRDGTVYTFGGGALHTLSLSDGSPIDELSAPTPVGWTACLGSDTIYVPTGTHVVAWDLSNQTERWRFELDADSDDRDVPTPVLAGDTLLVTGDGGVYALDPSNGDQLWHHEMIGEAATAAVPVDGDVFTARADGTVSALKAEPSDDTSDDTNDNTSDDTSGETTPTGNTTPSGSETPGGTATPSGSSGDDSKTTIGRDEETTETTSKSGGGGMSPAVVGGGAVGGGALLGGGYYAIQNGIGPFAKKAGQTVASGSDAAGRAGDTASAGASGAASGGTGGEGTLGSDSSGGDGGPSADSGSGESSGDSGGDDGVPVSGTDLVSLLTDVLSVEDIVGLEEYTTESVSQGVLVAKGVDTETFPVPALHYEVEPARSEPVTVRLFQPIPDGVDADSDLGFHEDYGEDDWTVEEDRLVFERVVEPGETAETLVAMRETAVDNAEELLASPEFDVEAAE